MESPGPSQAFVVKAVGVSEENDALVLGLAGDRRPNPSRYLMFQIATVFDPQDESLGMSGIYVELDTQANCGYFDEVKFALSESELQVWLKGRHALKGVAGGDLRVGLEIPPGEAETLKESLRRILAIHSKRRQ